MHRGRSRSIFPCTRGKGACSPSAGTRTSLLLRKRCWPALLPLIVLSGFLVNWAFLAQLVFAAPLAGTSAQGHNTYQQFLKESQAQGTSQPFQRPSLPASAVRPQLSPSTSKAASTLKHLPSVEPATMQDLTYTLDNSFVLHRPVSKAQGSQVATVRGTAIPAGTTPLVAKGDDGRLEVQVPRGSLDFAHATLADGSAPIGQLLLRIHQISGHFIEAESILGTYQLQVVDSLGHTVQGVVLVKPVTLVYHYQTWEMTDLNLNPKQVHLSWPVQNTGAQPITGAAPQTSPVHPASIVVPMSNNPTAHTLTAQTTTLSVPLTASGSPEIAAPGKPDLFEASGNSGQYSYSYPLAVAPGPNGFTPQLQLNYSSQSTNERYSRRAPASDEGEGFSLSLGSISSAISPSSSTGGATVWFFLNGVDGVSDRLVPSTTANFYETQHLSHLLIQWNGSCWNVWGLSGAYSQLGCTSDSVRQNALGAYEWDLNETLSMLPAGSPNQASLMQVTYLQDLNGTTTRDSQIKQITYGYATESGSFAFTHIAGTVDFHYHMPSVPSGQSNFATAYGTNFNCASSPPSATTLRCDDPGQFGSIAPPDVMSTMSLDSVTSYVGADSANQPAYQYSFSYQDQPFSTNYFDPFTFTQQAAAGEHLLTQITPTVYVSGTAHQRKGVIFGYTGGLRDSYDDPNVLAIGGKQDFSGQTFWNFLNRYQDLTTGEGANITYELGYSNPHGTPYTTDSQGNVTDDRFDPFYCANNANNSDPSKQCNGVYAVHDDDSWTMQLVTQISALGTDSSGKQTVATTSYHYALTAVPAANDPVGCNPITGSGVPAQEADCVMDSWSPGYNGTQTPQHDADWQDYYHTEYRGFAVVYITSAAGNLTVDDYLTTDGWWLPDLGDNASAGNVYQEDVYQGNVASPQALLRETIHDYVNASLPAGNPYANLNECNGNENPVYIPCVATPILTKTTFFEGQGGSANAPWVQTVDTYDDINGTQGFTYTTSYHNLLQEVISSSNAPTITKKWTYAVTNQTINGWVYYNVDKVAHSEVDDSSGHVWGCQDTTYDEGAPSGTPTPDEGLVTTVKSYSTCGNASTALTSYTAYDQYGNAVASVDPLAAANPSLYSSDGCTLSVAPANLSASWTAGRYTSCTSYDTTHTATLPISTQNAFGQTTSTSYDYTSGAQPTGMTDANGQITSFGYAYDGSGNETINLSQPGENSSYTTRQNENSQCTTSSTLPCYEIDSNSSLYSNAISRTFYDSQGRAIETRTPGPTPGDDTVVITVYNDQGNAVFKTVPFQIASGSGWIDPNGAKDINGVAPAGTTTFMDALGRTIAVQDPNLGSAQELGLVCSTVLTGKYTSCTNYSWSLTAGTTDAKYYASATNIDPNGHVTTNYTNTQGETRYIDTYSGISGGTLTVQQVKHMNYNTPFDKPTAVWVYDIAPQNGQTITSVATTTMTYDDQGRLLTMSDPDQGNFAYTYDPDGHVLTTTQTSGSNSRTIGVNYDLLGRVGCEQAAAPIINATGACSAGGPLVQNTYDTTTLGTKGNTDFPVGQLTQSVASTYYPNSTTATVTEQFQHDQRGRLLNEQIQLGLPSSWNVTSALPTYQESMLYNDANQVTTTSTLAGSQGYTFSPVYNPTNGILQGLSNNGNSTANLATLTYTEHAQLAGITLLNGASSSPTDIASEAFSYDGNLRPTSLTATWLPGSGNSSQILSQGRAYDNAGNVIGSNTTFAAVPGQSGSGGSDIQNFCYDEQDRLVWSGNGGTQPGAGNGTCGSGTLTSSMTGAGYTAPFSYTNLGQIWQGPVNGQGASMQYLYCDSNHPHRLSGIYPLGTTCANLSGAVYTAGYDAFGNENYRSYQNVTASLFYDSSNHLVEWNAGSSGQEFYVYDAAGNRVLQRSISGGVTRLMVSAFGLQDLAFGYNGYVAGQTDYYSLAGHLIGEFNGTATTYNLTDALGSVLTSFSKSAVIGEQTYGPYGNQRYSVGTIGTSKGYTGQLHDSITNLDYYNARYYDPVAGVFLSPDSVQGNGQGMDPYAYVAGNPETATDPTGKMVMCGAGDGCGGGDSSSGGSSFSIGNIVSGILSGSGGFSGGCGSSHAEANACIMRKGSISKSECDAKCAAKAKPVAQSAAQKLRNMASQVQGILDGFAHCADLDFNCIVHELGNDMLNGSKIGGPIGTLIGGIIGCLTTFAIGCIPGITVGTAIGNLIGAVGGLGYFVYAEFVEHSTVSMLQSLQQLLNSGASDFEHQQLDDSQDPTLYPREELASQDEAFDEAVGNFTVGNNGELGDKANAIAYQALSIYDGAVNSELNYFAN